MPEEIVRVNEANQKSDRLEKQVATPADFTSPEVLYEDLIQKSVNTTRHRIYPTLNGLIR